MQPAVVTKPSFSVVGLRIRTQAMTQAIPELWQQFGPQIDAVPQIAEPQVSYGLMDNFDPAVGQLDYMAGVAVVPEADLPTGMTRWDVPANNYVVFETTIPTLGETFGYIYNTWLPTSGYHQAAGPYFERYGESFDPADPASTLSIYIPVEQ
jgi:AraC family transcriptional regulator